MKHRELGLLLILLLIGGFACSVPQPQNTDIPPMPSKPAASAPSTTETMSASFHVGDLVQSGEYAIEVISAKKVKNPIRPGGFVFGVFIEVEVKLFKQGEPNWDTKETEELTIIDSDGQKYSPHPYYTIFKGSLGPNNVAKPNLLDILFVIAEAFNKTGFRLQYRDLPLIDLGI